MGTDQDTREALESRYAAELDYYKFQVDLAVKVALAILTIIGTLVAFITTRDDLPRGPVMLSFAVPLLLCAAFAYMYWRASIGAAVLQTKHAATAKRLGIEPFHLGLLAGLCQLGTALCVLAGIGVAFVVYALNYPPSPQATKSAVLTTLVCRPGESGPK